MKLEAIQECWNKDSKIDKTELSNEAIRIPQLHSKYYKMFSSERLILKKLKRDRAVLYKKKFDYYTNDIDLETLREMNWEPQPRKILKSDVPMHMDADDDMFELDLRISLQEEKVMFLESIIKTLNSRSFDIRNAIEWEKFITGVI